MTTRRLNRSDSPVRIEVVTDSSADDVILSIDQTSVPTAASGNATAAQWLGWLANRIRAITGKPNWWEAPDASIAELKSQIDNLPEGSTGNGYFPGGW